MKKALFSFLRQPLRIAPYYFLSVAVLSLVGTLRIHYEYWGYLLEPPGLLEAAKTITKVDQLIPVKTSECDTPEQCKFVIDPSRRIASYYDPSDQKQGDRLLVYLQDTGKLPPSFDSDLQEDIDLYAPMFKSPIIATPEEGYTNRFLEGIIMIGKTASGEQRVFISANGGQVCDDHYPYYEAIFTIGQNGKTVHYLEGQRFFFDIAGFEGSEGGISILVFGVLVTIIGYISMMIVIILYIGLMAMRLVKSL